MNIDYLADHHEFITELAELHFAEWNCLNPGQGLDVKKRYIRNNCGRNGVPTFLIAAEDDELIGSASLIAHDMEDRPDLTPWLADVFVKPEYRGRGVAASLVQRIEAEAKTVGIARLYLYTPDAAGLYKRLGWSSVEACSYKGIDVVIMHKMLR